MNRLEILRRLVSFCFLPLVLGLVYLQVFSYQDFRQLSERNAIRTVHLDIPRGPILDRDGRVLAEDRVGHNLSFVPYDLQDPAATAATLAPLLDRRAADLERQLTRRFANPFEPQLLARNMGEELAHQVAEQIDRLPGVTIRPGLVRHYPLAGQAAPLLGYLGEISPRELEHAERPALRPGDLLGRGGIEAIHDHLLRGERGGTQVEVNALGRHIRELGHRPSKPGHRLRLTIDSRLQQIAATRIADRAGAVVALCPQTGEVLAMVSNPSFDPARPAAALGRPDNPFVNRAIRGQYPPGSVFKIVTAVAGLETGLIRTIDQPDTAYIESIRSEELRRALVPEDIHYCPGRVEVGDRTFHCWREEGHGWVAFRDAMARSCNIYFGRVGMAAGERRLLEYARKMGLGAATGIDLAGEHSGLVPPTGRGGGALNLSIGQGALLVTPLQLAVFTGMLANGGNIMKPFLVSEIASPDGQVLQRTEPRIRGYFYLPWETMGILTDSLKAVMDYGTGFSIAIPGLIAAGKTATVQVARREHEMLSRGLFICWTSHPERPLAMAVVLEEARWGVEAAAIAAAIVRDYYALLTAETAPDNGGTATPAPEAP